VTHDEYYKFHDQFCEQMTIITRKKSQDYTGDSGDPFSNFRAVEKLGICSTEQGFLVRMMDKMVRISNLADGREAAVLDEKLEDTLFDLANYAALFAGYLKSQAYFQASRDTQDDDFDHEGGPTWDDFAPQGGTTWQIQARNLRGEISTLESHHDPEVADSRMQLLELDWPTFTLTVVPVNDQRKKTS